MADEYGDDDFEDYDDEFEDDAEEDSRERDDVRRRTFFATNCVGALAACASACADAVNAAEEVPNATLQILDLGCNVVGRDGAEALKNVLVRQAAPKRGGDGWAQPQHLC